VNTDIHRAVVRARTSSSESTERRPRCVRCSGPQQRLGCAAPGCRSCMPLPTPPARPRPRAATRRPDPRPRLHRRPSSRIRGADLHRHHGGTASAVAARRVRSGRAARGRNGRCRPLCGRRHRVDGAGGQRAGQLPGHRRPRTPSAARHEPADPGRRRQRDDQRGRAELSVCRCPLARRWVVVLHARHGMG
jgi:hypothetical protein